jgi:CubicO group peptidase (beta-lactamase class C family)
MIQNGVIIYRKAFGEGWTPERVVPIASATKAISGGIIMALVDEGKIRLDDKASLYLSSFTGDKADITIRQMFSHTSGLDFLPRFDFGKGVPETLQQAAMLIGARVPLIAEPGTVLHYGNQAIQAVGAIAEIVTGKPWAEIFEEQIKGPINMAGTTYGPSKNPVVAGGAYSNVDDFGNYVWMLMNDGVFQGKRILSTASVEEMLEDQSGPVPSKRHPWKSYRQFSEIMPRSHYGIGWWIEEWEAEGGRAIEASSGGAFGCQPFVDRRRGLCGVYLPLGHTRTPTGEGDFYNDASRVYLEVEQIIKEIVPVANDGGD